MSTPVLDVAARMSRAQRRNAQAKLAALAPSGLRGLLSKENKPRKPYRRPKKRLSKAAALRRAADRAAKRAAARAKNDAVLREFRQRSDAERDANLPEFFRRFVVMPRASQAASDKAFCGTRRGQGKLAVERLNRASAGLAPVAPGVPVADAAKPPADAGNAFAFPQIAGLLGSSFPDPKDLAAFLRWLGAEYRGEVKKTPRRQYRLLHPLLLRAMSAGKPLQPREENAGAFLTSVVPLGKLAAKLLGAPVVTGTESRHVLKGGLRWAVGIRVIMPGSKVDTAAKARNGGRALQVFPSGPVGDFDRELPGFGRYLFDLFERGGMFYVDTVPTHDLRNRLLALEADRGDESDELGRGLVALPAPQPGRPPLVHIVDYETPSDTLCGLQIDLDPSAPVRRLGISAKKITCPACAKYAAACRGTRLDTAALLAKGAKDT